MKTLGALLAGVLFGSGLLLSGMNDPERVLGFLDIAGIWNPSLAFTMAGAIAIAAPAFWLARRRVRSLSGAALALPSQGRPDGPLWFGSALFGVGQGLSGICPGPALLPLTSGAGAAWVFGACMAMGMYARGWRAH